MANSWLANFLRSRGLHHPDGRMLYAYGLTDSEFSELERELQSFLKKASFARALAIEAHLPALFVLYAAEWWKRTYAGGAWGWGPILERLTSATDEVAPNLRSDCVVNGLRYWGHRPLKDGMRFLGAIVSHGGLPMRLLAHGAGSVNAVLAQVVRLANRYRWDRQQTVDSVRDRHMTLPAAYRRDEITELLGDIASAVVELKSHYDLAGASDPVAHLDRVAPDWRARFPISMENAAARTLLQDLVVDVSAQRLGSDAANLFACERRLTRVDGSSSYSLSSIVTFPARSSEDALSRLFLLNDGEAVPRAFAIDLETSERVPFVDGRAILGSSDGGIAFAGKRVVLKDDRAALEHRVTMRTAKGDLGSTVTVLGGALLSDEEPWVFACVDEHTARYVGAGSATLPDPQALVAIGSGWHAESVGNAPSPETVGQVGLAGSQRVVLRLDGETRLTKGEISYRIRLNQTRESKSMLQWDGHRLPEAGSALVFRSRPMPQLCEVGEDGLVLPVRMSDQVWRTAGHNQSVPARSATGPLDVLVVREGETVGRQRIWILPPDARIRYESGETPGQGEVVLEKWGAVDVGVDVPPPVQAQVSRDDRSGEIAIRLTTEAVPPASVRLELIWHGIARTLRLDVPFPASGGRFIGADGRVIDDRANLLVDELSGARLQIFDGNRSLLRQYQIEMALAGASQAAPIERPVAVDAGGRSELRLIDLRRSIESLLGTTDDLDRAVKVTLRAGARPACSISVGRYSTRLGYCAGGVELAEDVAKRLPGTALERVEVRACSLSILAEERSAALQRADEGEGCAFSWDASGLDRRLNPWLIYPAHGSSLPFRPMLWNSVSQTASETDLPELPRCPLGQAMLLKVPHERLAAMGTVLDAMAADFSHTSWLLIGHLWSSLAHLPLSALDVWCVIGKRSRAALAFLMRAVDEPAITRAAQRLRDEVGWAPEIVSLADWHASTTALWRWYRSSIPEELVQIIDPKERFVSDLTSRFDALKAALPALEATLDFVRFEITNVRRGRASEICNATPATVTMMRRRLYQGVDSLLNTELMLDNINLANWPAVKFFEHGVTAFLGACPQPLRGILGKHLQMLFVVPKGNDHTTTVINTPMLCALWALTSTDSSWWDSTANRTTLRQIHDFAPIWFDRAFEESCVILLSMDGVVESTCFIDFSK